MGCGCGGQTASAAGPVRYLVINGSNEATYRSVSEARAAAARTGGTLYKEQNGLRTRL